MSCVSVVFTVHEEQGRANVSELEAILVGIQPQVIFLEVPPADFNDYYETCSRVNLESRAVRQHRKRHSVKLVPVDLLTPEQEFFEDQGYLWERIADVSPEFRQLLRWDTNHLRAYGFSYLNSAHSSKLWSDVYNAMLGAIERLGDGRLREIYEAWVKILDLREMEMMANILNYCRECGFERSAFLIGAAHRQRIIDKFNAQSAVDFVLWAPPST